MSQATLSNRPYQNSNLFSGHYLDERLELREEWNCDEKAREVMGELQSLYELEGDLLKSYKEDALIDEWISKVIDILGFGTQVETTLPESEGYVDILLFESEGARRDAASVYLDTQDTSDLFGRGVGLLEAKQWDADFSQRFSEQRPYRNASHQIKHYLERTPESIQWGILTNGRKWRLYGTKDYETQTYYEVDLPELLEHGDLDQFKYFYLFFRPEAFQETGGTTFLDAVWSESETAAQELGEDLQDNVFTALRLLGRGLVETNDLDIDPDNEEELSQLKNQSLVYLYRLMFVLYAEARGLIHPEGQKAVREYEQNFSLDELRLGIHEMIGEVDDGFESEYSEYSTTIWNRLQNLFHLVDKGEESLGIPPYNGGLFNEEQNQFLSENQVNDRYLAEVIYRLSTTENDEGRYVLADYADLDTRHLGSVYEGLLEHQFRIAPEDYAAVAEDSGQVWKPATDVTVAEAVETVPEGGLYVVNDEGERKATGAYYTPDHVVTYIVEETIDPLLDEIREDLIEQGFEPGTQEYIGPYLQRVTQLKILDPAMGSGHFLTRATGYLAEQVMNEVREVESEMGVAFDEQHVRREIAKECIYGVDLNEMAVELAKLSMWLETLAADRPLAFLDHHLKSGNSLIGSDVTEVLSDDTEENGGQLTLQQSFALVRERTLDHVMDLMQELLEIDNETLEDIKSMEEIYNEIHEDPFYQRLFELTNVHTAEEFDLDVPNGVYERMANTIENEDEWEEIRDEDWFKSAQDLAKQETFFHWELEFPEVFFNENGENKTDDGFDAVIGNPPYVKIQNIPNEYKKFYDSQYVTSEQRYDLYSLFVEKGSEITNNHLGYILPNKFFESNAGAALREYLAESNSLRKIVDFGQNQVFSGASTYTCLIFLSKGQNTGCVKYSKKSNKPNEINNLSFTEVDIHPNKKWNLMSKDESKILDKIENTGKSIDEISEQIFVGIQTSADDIYVLNDCTVKEGYVEGYSKSLQETVKIESKLMEPYIGGNAVSRYASISSKRFILYPYDRNGDIIPEENLSERFPLAYEYLNQHQTELINRGSENHVYDPWYSHWRPRSPQQFKREKILIPEISKGGGATYDKDGNLFHSTTVYSPIMEDEYKDKSNEILGIINSKLVWYYIMCTGTVLRGGYYRYKTDYLNPISIPVNNLPASMRDAVNDILNYQERLDQLNVSLLDHIGSYSEGKSLSEIGLVQPVEGTADSILSETADERENLRIGTAKIIRESSTSITIELTARYKPENEDDYETDQWGYTETDPIPALRILNITESEADLIEAFVPVAVDEAGGFANFRETATKTNSLIDRLKKLTLPAIGDVRQGLKSYTKTKSQAEELERNIKETDKLIDEIVYELYGLTPDEIETVEKAVEE
ncbi:Eco57I restriction-modification methylase domain-containing protein [Natrialbaceae archaeon GCM10025810]|uniref:Eco57I restriction-modification methylase domain-containing protein n=1 Tax=Halovalidus salilacus TaxID=3075124 RepID=UPI00361BA012